MFLRRELDVWFDFGTRLGANLHQTGRKVLVEASVLETEEKGTEIARSDPEKTKNVLEIRDFLRPCQPL